MTATEWYAHWPEAKPEHVDLATADASLGVGHVWTNVRCQAYRTFDPTDCVCRSYD